MPDNIQESYAEIQKLISRKLESNADKNNMESLTDPFVDKADTEFFATPNLQAQLDEVIHLCQFGGNVVSLLGDNGAGKSVFLAEAQRELAETSHCCIIDSSLMMNADDIFRQIISQLELPITLSSNTGEMLIALRKSMSDSDLHRVVIIIDDADNLIEPILSALLSLFQGAHGGQFHLLLSGDKNLIERLDAMGIVDVLIYDIHLSPFSLGETNDYISLKLSSIKKDVKDYFSQSEIEAIHKESKGLPLAMNRVILKHFFRIENIDDLGPLDTERKSGLPLLHMGLLIILLAGLIMMSLYITGDEPIDNKQTTTVLSQPVLTEARPDAIDEAINKLNAERNIGNIQEAPSSATNIATGDEATPATLSQLSVIAKVMESPPLDSTALSKTVDADSGKSESTFIAPEQKVAETSRVDSVSTTNVKKESEREAEVSTLDERALTAQASPGASNASKDDALSAGEQVVMQWADTSFTLQLIGAEQKANLVKFIAAQPNSSSLLLLPLMRNSKPWYVVVTGVYENTLLARQAIQSLPQEQVNSGPWPKKISDLKQDMRSFRRN
jgi:DamX protein